MTKRELVTYLNGWNDDTEIEISVPKDFNKPYDGRMWCEIENVEAPTDGFEMDNCLIIVGEITMF